MHAPIRFGVVCDGDLLPAWQARCLDELMSLDGVECALRVQPRPEVSGRPRGLGGRLFRLYRDQWARPRALRAVPLPGRVAAAPSLAWGSSAAAVGALPREGLDFLLHLGGPLPEGAAGLARYGVWSLRTGSRSTGGPRFFREILAGESVMRAMLCRELAPGRGVGLKQGRFAIARHSYARSVDELHFACAHWVRELCIDLRNGHTEPFAAAAEPLPEPDAGSPTLGELLRFLGVQLLELVKRTASDLLRHEQWTVGVAQRPIESFLETPDTSDVSWFPTLDRNHYLADPFVAELGGKRMVLSELYDHRSAHATIAAWTLDAGPGAPRPVTVIEADVHLSYPFVFEHEGQTFCIPESCAAREIALYRADPASCRWSRVATLVEGVAAADSTLFRHEGRFWIACNDVERGRHRDLCLFHADDLMGPWTPHATNPVLMDVCCARPGGTPFVHEGRLYRPAQDCSTGYGKALVIRRITHLSPTCFREVTAAVVRPDPGGAFPDGIHTLSAAGHQTLLDAKRTIFHPMEALHVLRSALRKRL